MVSGVLLALAVHMGVGYGLDLGGPVAIRYRRIMPAGAPLRGG
jgi:hypothetical protein